MILYEENEQPQLNAATSVSKGFAHRESSLPLVTHDCKSRT